MIRRLRLKFVCINMTIVTVMLLVIFGMVLRFTSESLRQQSLDMLQQVSDSPRHGWLAPRDTPLDAQLPYFSVSVDLWGQLIASTGSNYALPDAQTLEQVISLALQDGSTVGYLKDYHLRFQRSTTPFGQSLVFVDVSGETATLTNLAESCAFIGLVSLAAFWGLSVLLARWAIRPVETAWNQQRQFVADASHELKTPLTVILTNAELLQQPDYDDEARSRFVSSILTMSHQMRGLVESLLELARVDNGAANLVFSELDYSRLIQDGLLPFEPVYFERGLALESAIQEGIRLRGSAAHLRQVLDILLDNAAKYSDPNATVTVTLQRQGSHCLLKVSNPGAPISPEDLKNIFKRFYRVDKARAMNRSYGLGLSIAQSVIQQHGGRIWAESAAGRNTFCVQLNTL